MSKIRKSSFSKVIAGFASIATGLMMMGAVFVPVQAATVEELTAQINSLLSTIAALQSQLSSMSGGSTATVGSYTFAKNLKQGDTGTDVMNLQKVLNMSADTKVAVSGAGSPGNETSTFGPATKAAVIKFQEKYASEILTPVGLSKGTGFVGASTRAKLGSMGGAVSTTPSTPSTPGTPAVVVPAGTGLSVVAATQPAASLAPASAARIPFTKVTFTAGNDGDVTVNSVTIERTGLAQDAAFAGIVLLDENGTQLGIEKTLNSDHKATVGDAFVVKAGTSRTMTIAGNMGSSLGSYAGQVASLSVVAVNTSATVSGSLPITGAGHTINSSLSIGTVTVAAGPLDPGASNSKEIGTTGYTFSSVKVTAGSAEKVRLHSIRWNQSGSAATADVTNVKTYVEGTVYDVSISSDGKYYTTSFGDGVVVDKGASKEIYIKGDIAGGSARTVDFDLYKRTDIYVTGETYGYGITPPNGTDTSGSDDGAFHSSTNPWYDAYQATVSNGSLTAEAATSVGAQNIAINTANQVLGGISVEAKGEPISVASMVFNIVAVGDEAENITNITLVGPNGNIVAGPVDGVSTGTDSPGGTVTFSDTVTFPVGKGTYTLKGKLGTAFTSNDTVQASTTPSGWGTVTGQSTGNSITPSPSSAITMNTMTVKAPVVTISVLSTPLAQTAVAGGAFNFAKYEFDASQSGDDIRFNSVKLALGIIAGTAANLTNCGLNDGSTALQTGSNLVNPTAGVAAATASSTSFTFDNGLIIPKGTVKTLTLNCNTSATTTTDKYQWGIDGSATQSATGVLSGQSLSETSGITINDASGQQMTMTTGGSYTVVDDSTPGYTIVSPGTEATLLKLKFTATSEDIDIRRVAFQLASNASNTAVDLVGSQVSMYDGSTLIGTATFANNGDYATSSAIAAGAFRVAQGASKTMTIKGTIAGVSAVTGPLTASGDLLIVAYDGNANGLANGNYGVGVAGGTNIAGTSSDVTPSGVRIMRAYPTFARLSMPSTTLQNSSGYTLYRFSVYANNNDIALGKLTFTVSSSSVSATTSAYGLYAYTDSGFSNPDTTFSSDGLINANKYTNGLGVNADTSSDAQRPNVLDIYPDKASATTTYKVPSGTTRYFALKATVGNLRTTTGSESFTVQLDGDAAFPTNAATLMLIAGTSAGTAGVDNDTNDDLIWSPISTTSSESINDLDWTNGYLVPGLPTTYMDSVTHTFTI